MKLILKEIAVMVTAFIIVFAAIGFFYSKYHNDKPLPMKPDILSAQKYDSVVLTEHSVILYPSPKEYNATIMALGIDSVTIDDDTLK
jgi:hypothetical protein